MKALPKGSKAGQLIEHEGHHATHRAEEDAEVRELAERIVRPIVRRH